MNAKNSVDQSRLAIPLGIPLSDGLGAAFSDMIAYACSQVDRVGADPVTAVHEYRKSVRRVRSLVRLVRRLISADTYDRVGSALRTVHRSTSALRDRDIVIDTLDSLDTRDVDDASRPHIQRVRDALLAARSLVTTPVEPVLARGAAALFGLIDQFTLGLPLDVTWRDVTGGLDATYRRARRDMRATLADREGVAIHDWRKRNKELTYQVELLSTGVPGERLHKLRKRLARLSTTLGNAIDLMVLEEYLRDHASARERELLKPLIARAHQRHFKRASELGARLYAHKPAVFCERVIGVTRAAHKLARKRRGQKYR